MGKTTPHPMKLGHSSKEREPSLSFFPSCPTLRRLLKWYPDRTTTITRPANRGKNKKALAHFSILIKARDFN